MKTHPRLLMFALAAVVLAVSVSSPAAEKIAVLIVDGQNNHDWRSTTPVLKDILLKSGLFTVDVMTSPDGKAPKEAWAKFRPDPAKYGAVVSNYNGQPWPQEVNQALVKYVSGGGGLVIIHAANNAFGGWKEWNDMIGLGWRGAGFGDRVFYDFAGKLVRWPKGKGPGTGHGRGHPFELVVRNPAHAVTAGMPLTWTHANEELYHGQRGPAKDIDVLVTAWADKKTGGTDASEPMVFTIPYGQGRVFVNLLGHGPSGMKAPGYAILHARGTEWAATGKVTLPIPAEVKAPTIELPRGKAFDGFRGDMGEWQNASEVTLDPADPKRLAWKPGTGALINGKKGRTRHLITWLEHGDVEAHIEFVVPKGSNSGVYFQGRYEIQVFDSWGVAKPKHGDCGGIYQRWSKGKGFEGHPPRVNASLEPGKWQSFDVIFRAPRFGADGKKTANAKFVKVVHNGKVVHENVELTGPTRASLFHDENPLGPIELQGDHGPVAYRNLRIKPVTLKP